MLLIEPDPFYLLLEETEIATASASAIGSHSVRDLKRRLPGQSTFALSIPYYLDETISTHYVIAKYINEGASFVVGFIFLLPSDNI